MVNSFHNSETTMIFTAIPCVKEIKIITNPIDALFAIRHQNSDLFLPVMAPSDLNYAGGLTF